MTEEEKIDYKFYTFVAATVLAFTLGAVVIERNFGEDPEPPPAEFGVVLPEGSYVCTPVPVS